MIERAVIVSEGNELAIDPAWLVTSSPVETARTWAEQEKARILAALSCAAIALWVSHAGAASILPLRSEEATLLIGVDSARTSVVTMVAVPGESQPRPDRPLRRLIGTAVVLNPHRLLTTASMAITGGSFSVLLGDGLKREARIRGVDRQSNVALFTVEGEPLQPLRQASPQSIAPGSWVAVISNVNITRPQITLGQGGVGTIHPGGIQIGAGKILDTSAAGALLKATSFFSFVLFC